MLLFNMSVLYLIEYARGAVVLCNVFWCLYNEFPCEFREAYLPISVEDSWLAPEYTCAGLGALEMILKYLGKVPNHDKIQPGVYSETRL